MAVLVGSEISGPEKEMSETRRTFFSMLAAAPLALLGWGKKEPSEESHAFWVQQAIYWKVRCMKEMNGPDADILAGRTKRFSDVDEMLDSLKDTA